MLNLGARHDLQTHLGDTANFSPRLGFNWTPFGNRRTAVRVSAGRYYEMLDASLYEQTLRVDGRQQRDLVISSPGYPDPFSQGVPLAQRPPSIIRLGSGSRHAVELAPLGRRRSAADARGRASGPRTRGAPAATCSAASTSTPRSTACDRDPSVGSVTQVESTGRSLNQSLETRLSLTYQPARLSGSVAYTLGEVMDDSDGALSLPPDSSDLSSEWGPSRQDIRHRSAGIDQQHSVGGVPRRRQPAGAVGLALHDHHRARYKWRRRAQRAAGRPRPQQRSRRLQHEPRHDADMGPPAQARAGSRRGPGAARRAPGARRWRRRRAEPGAGTARRGAAEPQICRASRSSRARPTS